MLSSLKDEAHEIMDRNLFSVQFMLQYCVLRRKYAQSVYTLRDKRETTKAS
jgi:hypothetical protein